MSLSRAELARLRIRSLGYLAPKFRTDILALVQMLEGRGHDPVIFETLRLPALQAEYFASGVSRQKDVLWSMHGHGLAVDIISAARGWDYSDEWKADLEACCKELGLTCGGRWTSPVDWPHVQHGSVPGKVPATFVSAFNSGGLHAVWTLAGAL